MKTIICLYAIFLGILNIYAQKDMRKIKLKCCKNMPKTSQEVQDVDTLFVLFQKSNEKKYEQRKVDIADTDYRNYHLGDHIYFPMQIYDYNNFEKVNIRQPYIYYENKSYICKNMYRTIDVYFLQKFGFRFVTSFWGKRKTTFFMVELDSKIKNKYKIVQVNQPTYAID